MGYHRAGFDVVGIDIKPQPRYPFPFIQGDALNPPVRLEDFDVIHASPPCQDYSVANNVHKREYPRLIEPTRDLLMGAGILYVIENVPGAPLRNPVQLCGRTFGLGVKRHRLFETNWWLMVPPCGWHGGDWVTVFGETTLERRPTAYGKRRNLGADRGRMAMGTPWMIREDIGEAIPPAYTEFIGEQLVAHLRRAERSA